MRTITRADLLAVTDALIEQYDPAPEDAARLRSAAGEMTAFPMDAWHRDGHGCLVGTAFPEDLVPLPGAPDEMRIDASHRLMELGVTFTREAGRHIEATGRRAPLRGSLVHVVEG